MGQFNGSWKGVSGRVGIEVAIRPLYKKKVDAVTARQRGRLLWRSSMLAIVEF